MSFDVERVCQALSTDRLSPLLAACGGDVRLALQHYQQNILLSEALYPGLQLLEVVLRNRFEITLLARYGSAWYQSPNFVSDLTVGRQDRNKLTQEERQLQSVLIQLNTTGKALASGRVVAGLNFGFWTGLLGTAYKSKFWGPAWTTIVPHQDRLSKAQISQDLPLLEKTIRRMLRDIRHLRNRVFHHEPVWNDPKLWDKYQDLRTLIQWMEPEILAWSDATQVDRFPGVFQQLKGLRP